MEQPASASAHEGQFIFLSRNSKLARMFQEVAPAPSVGGQTRKAYDERSRPAARAARAAGTACPKLQAVAKPSLELTRPLAAALMREQAALRCRTRGVLLDNEYVRDICAAGAHERCPFLGD